MAKIGSIGRLPEGKYALKVDDGWQILIPIPPTLPDLNIGEVIYDPTALDGLEPGSVIYCEGEVYSQYDYGLWALAGVNVPYSSQEILDNYSEGEIEVLRRG